MIKNKELTKMNENLTLLVAVLQSDLLTNNNPKARETIKKIITLMKIIDKEIK